ncbi:disks large 1 tumor suppressor protein-like [Trichogramma pretiosum]|uniref:disks large 1 tumor suppressor protein-like n=1 Tax=Trichogramma pretiosum TaxID=7493 RepID=UPI0006C9889C|nr:disks large 1 tumor suppressor protein-like [Trichogramma pretiosum]
MAQTTYKHQNIETHRALELLSDFYGKLIESQEKYLVIETERLIRLLKSKFFQALIDIREYYQITALDSSGQITYPYFDKQHLHLENTVNVDTVQQDDVNEKETISQISSYENLEVSIERGESGFGFSIAGGTDNQHENGDNRIYITKISHNGSAALSGLLKTNDILEKVNDTILSNVRHIDAVNALKTSRNPVKLTIRRKNITQIPIKIDLEKINGTFGFSVSGGRNNQHQSGDSSIFITKITEGGAAEKDGRIKIGQKIIGVQSSKEYINFENVTHEEAVEALKVASKNLRLFVIDSEFKRSTQQLSSKCDEDTVMISSHESLKNLDEPNDTSNLKNLNNKNNEIYLKRNVHGFGFNIIGGENNEGIFVSSILKDGPAWTDGKLKVGDQIIIVNEKDFKGISHEDAANYLKGCDEIRMSTEHDIAHYDEIKRNLCQMKSLATPTMKVSRKLNDVKKMLVKCLFDYDPEKDDDLPNQGLHFHFGDILFVINASDEEWWQAKKVQPLSSIGIGIIPGKKRWERKQRAKERCVKFEESTSTQIDKLQDKKKKNYTFSRRFPFMKNKEKVEDVVENEQSLVSCYTADGTESKDSCDKEILYRVELPYMDELTLVYVEKENEGEMVQRLSSDDEIIPYLEVIEIPLKQRRPIIILGPIKDQINDDLISEYPEKFESCIPHTTRPKKPDEVDGHDYHFVHSREIMENDIKNHLFIEAGQYNGNLYGTSISSIAAVASRNKHCILDVSENAIKRLYSTHFYPIILLIKLKSPDIIKKMNQTMNDETANYQYQRIIEMERNYVEYLTGIIDGETYEDIFEKVKKSIFTQPDDIAFIPTKLSL